MKKPIDSDRANELFRHIASRTSHGVGSPWAFIGAFLVVVVWGLSGPIFHYSDTWQLVINTSTTIITFLMVFLIQNTQNRDSHAIHLKLDELIRSSEVARNRLMRLENLTDRETAALQHEFDDLSERPSDAPPSRPPPRAKAASHHQSGASKTSSSITGARSSRVT